MKNIKKIIIIIVVAIIINIIYLCMTSFKFKINYVDSLFASGSIIFLIGLLSLVSSFGAFDTFGFTGNYLRHGSSRKHKSFGDYVENKSIEHRENRFNFIPYLGIGTFLIILSVIINII